MNEDLPTDFDIIVVGTGLSESIIAAAASRIGKKVLHVDKNDYYGDLWASFNLEGLRKFISEHSTKSSENGTSSPSSEDEVLVPTPNKMLISNLLEEWYIPEKAALLADTLQKTKLSQTEKPEEMSEDQPEGESDSIDVKPEGEGPRHVINSEWTQEKLLLEYRKFSIDLTPKLLYSRGALVEVLISSNIARYAEFRNVSRILTWMDDTLQEVPCSRSDVFATKQVSMVEKRMLMKLINDVLDDEKNFDEFSESTFSNFLKTYRLTSHVSHYVLYTMAAGTEETQFNFGLQRMKKFLKSLGRYGNSPFLWTMYGSGEMPQCFCRLCAVFGGTYCLNRPIKNVILDSENACKGITVGEQKINAPVVVMGIGNAPELYLPNPSEHQNVAHAIFVMNRSIKDCDKENLTYLRFPPLNGDKHPCNIIEVGPAASACPNNLYVLYLYKIQEKTTPKDDLESYISKLINKNIVETTASQSTQTDTPEQAQKICSLPQALWSFYYSVPDLSQVQLKNENIPKKLYLCAGPDHEVDYEFAVQQAKDIFLQIYPTEEFLPRAPDPDEIVFEGEEADENTTNENGRGDNSTSENNPVDSGENVDENNL